MSAIGSMVNRTVMAVIGVVIFLLVGIALGPTVIASVTEINATTLAGVPLSSVIILIGDYLPAFYYLALMLGAIAGIWGAVKYSD